MENRKMQTEYGFPCREAKPVWLPDGSQPNRYVQFLQKFTWDGDGALSLQLSCDSRARVCLNGERIGFAFYDGTDDTSWYETFDLSAAAVRGENTLEIEVWYQGVSSNCYTAGRAYVIFAVMRGEGACAVASGAQTLCRADTAYRAGKVPTNQTGMVWYYDQTAEPQRYAPAAELTTDGRRYAPRPIARQVLSGRLRSARTAICCRATGNRLSRRFCRHGERTCSSTPAQTAMRSGTAARNRAGCWRSRSRPRRAAAWSLAGASIWTICVYAVTSEAACSRLP